MSLYARAVAVIIIIMVIIMYTSNAFGNRLKIILRKYYNRIIFTQRKTNKWSTDGPRYTHIYIPGIG